MEMTQLKFTKRSVADVVRLAKIKSMMGENIEKVFLYICGGSIQFEIVTESNAQSEEILIDITDIVMEYLTSKANMKKITEVAYEYIVKKLDEKSIETRKL